MTGTDDRGDYIVEFTQIGGSVKVSAMDPATLTEASIVGPANLPRELLVRRAVQKLEFVLARNRRRGGSED